MADPGTGAAASAPPPLPDAMIIPAMDRALALARGAADLGEVPVGAVVLDAEGRILAAGANGPVGSQDPTAHAEIVALRKAARALQNYRLPGTTLVVTLEPCAMCAGAIAAARVAHLVFAADDPKGGAIIHGPCLFTQNTIHHRPQVHRGPGAETAGALLRDFFAARRKG